MTDDKTNAPLDGQEANKGELSGQTLSNLRIIGSEQIPIPGQQEKTLEFWLEEALKEIVPDSERADFSNKLSKRMMVAVKNGIIALRRTPSRHNFFFQMFFGKTPRILSLIDLVGIQYGIVNIDLDEIDVVVVRGLFQTIADREADADLLVECKLRTGERYVFLLLGEHKVGHDKNAIIQLLRYTVETIWNYRNEKGYPAAPDLLPILIIISDEIWEPVPFKDIIAGKLFETDKIITFTPFILHILKISDDVLKTIGKYSYFLYLVKGLCLKNYVDEVVERLEFVINASKNDSDKHQLKMDMNDFFTYVKDRPFDINIECISHAIKQKGGEIAMTYEEYVDQSLAEVARVGIRYEGLQEGLQKGREEGLQKGREEGLQEGRKEGRKEGLQEGMQKGVQKGAKEMLFKTLRNRFSDLSQKICDMVQGVQDNDTLDRLLVIGLQENTAEAFEKEARLMLANA
jgi:hypothetical protein